MSERVTMPALGESVTEGTVTRWLKSVGDTVEVDEPLLEVSTDKVDTEIPSPVAGTLQEILVQEDETVAVGADLALIGEGSGADGAGGEGAGGSSGAAETEDAEPEAAEPEDAEPEDAEPEDAEPEDAEPEAAEPEPPAAGPGTGGATGGAADETTADTTADTAAEPSGDTSRDTSGDASGDAGAGGGGQKVTMPALGESVTEGTVTRWLKSEGDTVEVDEPLLEVSTDKVDTEIPSPVGGVLTKILVAEDETVAVGGDLAVIGGQADGGSESTSSTDPGDDAPARQEQASAKADTELAEEQQVQHEGAAESQAQSGSGQPSEATDAAEVPPPQEAVGVGTQATQAKESGSDVSAYVTPLVRKLAAQHGVDLATLEGTGVGGRIRKQDVLDAARKAEQEAKDQPKAAPPADDAAQAAPTEKAPAGAAPSATSAIGAKRGSTEKMSRLRKVIATRMVESLQVSAQLTTVVEVDVTKVARLRAKTKDDFEEREGVKLSFMPFFALAATEALKQHPNVNASVEGDQIVYHSQENLGVAVDTEKGLIVPVIKDAGDLNIAGLARKIADLAQRTRTNKISPDELGGGTFTLTNTGSRGALFDTPIINQPQVAILGTGAVVKRPVVVTDELGGETIAIRSMVYLALTYDHRIVDGADAARFLETIKHRLQDGAFEV